jgi:hypothetical protein
MILIVPALGRGRVLDAAILRAAMEAAFGASDAAATPAWMDAYEGREATQVLFQTGFLTILSARGRPVRMHS